MKNIALQKNSLKKQILTIFTKEMKIHTKTVHQVLSMKVKKMSQLVCPEIQMMSTKLPYQIKQAKKMKKVKQIKQANKVKKLEQHNKLSQVEKPNQINQVEKPNQSNKRNFGPELSLWSIQTKVSHFSFYEVLNVLYANLFKKKISTFT